MSKHDVPQGSGFRVRYGFSKNGKDLKFVAPSGPDRDAWLSRLQLAAGSYVLRDVRACSSSANASCLVGLCQVIRQA